MTRPLRSTPTAPSRNFIAITSRSASTPQIGTQSLTGSSPLGTLPLAAPTLRDASTRACLPTFLARAADQAHDAYMPDTARPVNGHPPGSSQGTPDPPWF